MTDVAATLVERGQRYGDFSESAAITQAIKKALRTGEAWPIMPPDMREAAEMIAFKLARIVNGDPSYPDSWHDIAGYAQLVAQSLEVRHD